MKRLWVKMVLGYLVISFSVFFSYKVQMKYSNETIVVWSNVEYNPVILVETVPTQISISKEESIRFPEGAVIQGTIQVPTQIVVPEMTKVPIHTVIPEITQPPVPTITPTMTKQPVLVLAPEIPEDMVEPKTEKVTVEYNGKEIVYCNTSYRMKKEILEIIVSMVKMEPYISSFILYDINSEATISYNEERYYPVASTVKAPFVMTCLWQIEEDLYSLDDTMEYIEKYKVNGDGIIKKEKIGKIYTIKELVELAITLSDDIGYLMLQGYFGYEYYNQFLKNLGNRVTIGGGIKWGQTSALDSLRNWKEIYDYISSGRENACFFAELLTRTNKGFIRNVLGAECEIYNKMGWVRNQCCHDHAVVMDEEPYILIIMTMGDVGKENQKFIEDLAVILNEVHEEMVGGVSLLE